MTNSLLIARRSLLACCLALTMAPAALAEEAAGRATEKLPDGRSLAKIEAMPAAVELKHPYDYRQVLVTGELDSGERVDVTRLVQAELPAAVVTVSPTGQVRPKADGAGEIKFTLNGQTAVVRVTVSGQTQP